MDPGRAYDRGLLSSTFRDRLHEDDDGCRTFGADDVDVYLCRDVFRKIRIQMIDDKDPGAMEPRPDRILG